ncbi:MAG: serine/threonine-protein phosphatase [Anaerolineales bacterium]|nr:serine/threonine-protein phosphatase [Anaerolineales bacterium]MCL4259573.1 serine/threonine-protein phosphatase [Anaerolineales bacterium]
MMKFFDKLFGKKEKAIVRSQDMANTAPLTEEQIQAIVSGQSPHFDMQQLVAGCGQSVGKQRELNEDSIMALTATIAGNSGNLPFGLYLVADGMGGHQFGEIASNAAIRSVSDYIMKRFHPYLFHLKTEMMEEPFQEIMLGAVREAHKVIQREAPGSGTTLTAALVIGQQVTIAHVGDSRAYFVYPDGRLDPITRDHSLVKRLEELGHLAPEEAQNYPHRNVLYRALGQGDFLEPDIFTVAFPQPGYLMICSDGLWGVVAETDIQRSVIEAPTLQRACQNLVTAANVAGGPDNISVVLAQLIG